jgi:hypothetical protein
VYSAGWQRGGRKDAHDANFPTRGYWPVRGGGPIRESRAGLKGFGIEAVTLAPRGAGTTPGAQLVTRFW